MVLFLSSSRLPPYSRDSRQRSAVRYQRYPFNSEPNPGLFLSFAVTSTHPTTFNSLDPSLLQTRRNTTKISTPLPLTPWTLRHNLHTRIPTLKQNPFLPLLTKPLPDRTTLRHKRIRIEASNKASPIALNFRHVASIPDIRQFCCMWDSESRGNVSGYFDVPVIVVVVLHAGFVKDCGEEDAGAVVAHFAIHVGGRSP